jgi:hypothetical protein
VAWYELMYAILLGVSTTMAGDPPTLLGMIGSNMICVIRETFRKTAPVGSCPGNPEPFAQITRDVASDSVSNRPQDRVRPSDGPLKATANGCRRNWVGLPSQEAHTA